MTSVAAYAAHWRREQGEARPRLALELAGGIGALALAALACEFILPPMVAGAGGSPSSVVGDLVYPLGDLLLVCFAVGALAVTDWRPGRVLGTVALGLALGGIADGLSL